MMRRKKEEMDKHYQRMFEHNNNVRRQIVTENLKLHHHVTSELPPSHLSVKVIAFKESTDLEQDKIHLVYSTSQKKRLRNYFGDWN